MVPNVQLVTVHLELYEPYCTQNSLTVLRWISPDIHSILKLSFCGRVPWLYQYWPVGFMLFVVLCPGTPKGSTSSGSGFKASQPKS